VLFRNFKKEGPADLLLAYLTIYVGELLRLLQQRGKNKTEAKANVTAVSMSGNFSIPGEKGFPLPGFFQDATSRADQGAWRHRAIVLVDHLAAQTRSARTCASCARSSPTV
jgi:actin related protein 2/3 complex subunit 3